MSGYQGLFAKNLAVFKLLVIRATSNSFLIFAILCFFFLANFSASPLASTCLGLEVGLSRACVLKFQDLQNCKPPLVPFDTDTCLIERSSAELVQKIINAPWILPATLAKHFQTQIADPSHPAASTYSIPELSSFIPLEDKDLSNIEQASRSILYRIYREHDLPRIREMLQKTSPKKWKDLYAVADAVQIQIAFPLQYADSIAERGLLNQYEVRHSTGTLDLTRRLATESTYWELDLSALLLNPSVEKGKAISPSAALSLLPKYGYAVFRESSAPQTYFYAYGEVLAQLKSNVVSRSTFTPNDSLKNLRANLEMNSDFSLSLPMSTSRLLMTKNVKVTNLQPSQSPGNYSEAQILGKLSPTDVEHLLVNCFSGQPGQTPVNAISDLRATELSKKFLLPVYACKVSSKDVKGKVTVSTSYDASAAFRNSDTVVFEKGNLIASPE